MTCLFVQRLGVPAGSLYEPQPGSMADIALSVARRYGLSVAEIRGPQRARRFAHPRQEAYALAMATGRFATTQVGRFFGNRDHTTVMYGVRAHQARLKGETYIPKSKRLAAKIKAANGQ